MYLTDGAAALSTPRLAAFTTLRRSRGTSECSQLAMTLANVTKQFTPQILGFHKPAAGTVPFRLHQLRNRTIPAL